MEFRHITGFDKIFQIVVNVPKSFIDVEISILCEDPVVCPDACRGDLCGDYLHLLRFSSDVENIHHQRPIEEAPHKRRMEIQ